MSKASKEIMSLGKEELVKKLDELNKELIKLNAQVATGASVKNPGQVRNTKKTIARIHQSLAEKASANEPQKNKQGTKKSLIGGK